MMYVSDTIPYPWPYDGHFRPASSALLLLGDQAAIADRSTDVAAVRECLELAAVAMTEAGGAVIAVRFGRRPGRRGALMPLVGTPGWEVAAPPPVDHLVLDAAGWDATFSTDLVPVLREQGIDTIVLGGMAAEVTVDSTVRTLNDQGFECLVLTDGCAPLDPELGRHAHSSLTMSGGIFGALGTTSALIAALRAARSQEDSP